MNCECLCHQDPIEMTIHPGQKCVCNGGEGRDLFLPADYQPTMKKGFK